MGEDEYLVPYRRPKRIEDEPPPRSAKQRVGSALGWVLMVGFLAWLWAMLLGGSVLAVWGQAVAVPYVLSIIEADPWRALWLVFFVPLAVAFDYFVLLMWWFALRAIALGWKSLRGGWWLRLSDRGLERSDRFGRPRLVAWDEFDEFVLVGNGIQVGYRYSPQRRRTIWDRHWRLMNRGLVDERGIRADGILMGWWHRDVTEAVDLLNGWLARHRAVTDAPT